MNERRRRFNVLTVPSVLFKKATNWDVIERLRAWSGCDEVAQRIRRPEYRVARLVG